MILDSLENGSRYFPARSAMRAGLDFINKARAENPPDGRYDLDGENLYAIIQSYATAPVAEKLPESHRKYADIQSLLSGEEAIGWHPVEKLEVDTPYSEEKDIMFYRNAHGETLLLLVPGLFAVFYPHDAHKPGCSIDAPRDVRKIVVKVACP
ncbi:MAG: YhcH/YjgK/YiaL family protein [Nitrospinae bacterium]|nr:YhcH/YjgK/YiaL family protein [Nitrospinota bacterium]